MSQAPISSYLAKATPDSPRQSEASIIKLLDGRLMLAWTDFYSGSFGDDGAARIMARFSDDGGDTWSEPIVIQENIGRLNVMIASLLQLPTGRILLCFHRKDTEWTECHLMVKWSDDNARTWSQPQQITYGHPQYWNAGNDRFVRLQSGRIILPAGDSNYRDSMTAFYSDDDGESWQYSRNWVTPPSGEHYAEPAVVELADGTVLMLIRSDSGFMKFARSDNGGDTWHLWDLSFSHQPPSPYSPCNCKRVPGSRDLLMIWNCAGGHRLPLTAAISPNDAWTWKHLRHLESLDELPATHTYAYPSIEFDGNLVHVTYWDTYFATADELGLDASKFNPSDRPAGHWLFHLKYRRLPLSWFYGS